MPTVHAHKRLKKGIRARITDEHMAHQDYAHFATTPGLNKTEKRILRAMGHDEARHEKNLERIKARLKNG